MPKWLIITLSALYVLCPMDLIPDVIPVLGWLDDIGVLGYAVSALTRSEQPSEQKSSDM